LLRFANKPFTACIVSLTQLSFLLPLIIKQNKLCGP
jgi:hypothetical protein